MQVRVSTLSDQFEQAQGVPQGSILSTTLFNIKINNIVNILDPKTEGSLYVDDFCICYTVVPRYNDHFYKGNFDFRRNFIGNGSFLIKIYYIITETTLSDTDGDSR